MKHNNDNAGKTGNISELIAEGRKQGKTDITIRLSELSPAKRYLLGLPDRRIHILIEAAREKAAAGPARKAEGLEDTFSLPANALERLERDRRNSFLRDGLEKRWFEYSEKINGMSFTVPAVRKGDSDVKLYRRLRQECARRHFPENFAAAIVSSVMGLIRTGHMKPIILAGPAGCGKTTAGKLFAEIIGLPHYLISASRADHSHGIYGEGTSFQSPDVGELAKGILETGSPNLVYIIDEIEKAPTNLNRTSVADELLPVCDESVTEFRDNFLDYGLPIHRSPIIMTCNDLDMLSEPLRDRCDIYRFDDVELPRMKSIIGEYVTGLLSSTYPDTLSVDMDAVERAMDKLYGVGVRSIRQHRSLVEGAFSAAYTRLLDTDAERPMPVPEDLLEAQIDHIAGGHRPNVGF